MPPPPPPLLQTSTPYCCERLAAELAVQRASCLTRAVLSSTLHRRRNSQLEKGDASPVTVADFAVQALLIGAVHAAFPADAVVGEEDAGALRADPALARQVLEFVRSAAGREAWAPRTVEEMCDLIDLGGRGQGGREGRFWALDPIDGTASFVKNQQFAVSLALVEDGCEVVGVLGCPNLPVGGGRRVMREDDVDFAGNGVMLVAERGQGAYIRRMSRVEEELLVAERIERTSPTRKESNLKALHFIDSSLSAATLSGRVQELARRAGAPPPGTDIYSSHMRYAALILGGWEHAQVRFPATRRPPWSIWDHAGSQLIYTESGAGVVTDLRGRPVDFGRGRGLVGNWGLVAADASVHGRILELVTEMLAETGELAPSPVEA